MSAIRVSSHNPQVQVERGRLRQDGSREYQLIRDHQAETIVVPAKTVQRARKIGDRYANLLRRLADR